MINRISARVRSAWRMLRRWKQLDAGMHHEMRFRIEMEAERFEREEGLNSEQARRQAHVRFGGIEKYKERGRDTRGLPWVSAISFDARIGLRMLVKHRWLTLVGGFAMAVAIAIGAMFFEVMAEMLNPALPLPDGERVVAVRYATDIPGSAERKVLHDFVALRDELLSIEQLGAFRTVQHNLVVPNAPPEPIKVAEITASAFAVARTPPFVGRYLVRDDELRSAPAVVLIGHHAWRSRFDGDTGIIGRTIHLGGTPAIVVGVMPDGFKFPIDHEFWIPFRENPLQYKPLEGPELFLFGRLAPGATMEQAQAELTTIGLRAAAAHPETHARLRPIVFPYTRDFSGLISPSRLWMVRIAQLLIGALALVVAVNLAILMYARTVTRLGEIAIRTALGASRRRILSQLFMEAFALALVGTAAGLMLASVALDRIQAFWVASGSVPFWVRFDLSGGSVLYALGLAVLAAFVMGVVPGLKATGRRFNASLHELNGRSGTRLGPVWTTLVVAQIAAAVAVLPAAVYLSWLVVRMEVLGAGFATEKFVVSIVAMSDDASPVDAKRVGTRQRELISRLAAEPGVSAVTFSSFVPGFGPGGRIVQFEEGVPVTEKDVGPFEVSYLDVGLDMFDVYDAQIVAGRAFNAGDLGQANAVIVNSTFVQEFLRPEHGPGMRNRSAPGLRFRYARRPEVYEIVGVVGDFPSFPPSISLDGEPVVYHPAATGDIQSVVLSTKFTGVIPDGVIGRFRKIGAEIDPALQLRRVVPLTSYYADVRSLWRYLAWGIGLTTTSVLLLSAAGIYALMSLTVAQRTREIGIRAALGAEPHRLLLGILGRSMRRVGIGLLVGSMLSGVVFLQGNFGLARASALLLAVAALMMIVGLLAALGPACRILRIQATDALRAE